MTCCTNADEPLMDWSPWERYRQTVSHPCGYINAQDLERARENIKRYDWAKEYARAIESRAQRYLDRFTPEFIETMIPATTPIRCWQCPACRDKGLPRHPGGSWSWSLDDPEHIKCRLCGTVFPNGEYPETIVLQAKWGRGQAFSFYGGETFKQWGYPFYRPSFSGRVRVYKVNWCESMANTFAMAYAHTGKPEYAEITRKVLLRFAKVYPNWLLVSNYGEIADVDPHIAGLHIKDLPADELVYPPNKPDRALYAGYWAGCRAGGGGQEGYFTRSILEAYSLTYNARKTDGASLYSEEDRIKIERDLILESCVHLIGEKNINNKSVGNRIAVGMVGMALGHPGFVRFGLEGFYKTVDEWFLEDGCTPESPAYAMMSLNGIYKMGQAVRGYSDPPGYVDENGERIENLNLYETKYKLIWQRMFEGMQGNLRYPPYADSYRSTEIGARFAELLAANYPDNPQYLALLREYAGNNLGKGDRETALFFRDPGLQEKESLPLTFHDVFFPVLCLGQFRTGERGRESLTLLSATQYGGHHHSDSLNLYYWKACPQAKRRNGHELLTDLGYLWDHPMYRMTSRTFAHNTGMVDLQSQKTRGRDGKFHLFHTSDRVKVMEASSKAYDRADLYRRTVVLIDHNPHNSYIVDIFRLNADGSRDLVYHGPNSDYKIQGIDLEPGDIASKDKEIPFGLRFHVTGLHDEIYVDDVAITLEDGTQLAVNPSASEIDEKTEKPVGWNHYSGDGEAEWGAASPGRTDDHCAYLKVTKGPVNQALIQGDTNGYTGLNALKMPAGKKGEVSFWIKGSAQGVNVGLVTWRGDPAHSGNRVHVDLCSVPVIDQWIHHSADFSVGPTVDLENVKSADSSGTWTAIWKIADDMQFSARHCGQPGELVYIGDGWGQRDHRNTDLGVTIPYIVRRHQPERGASVFCTLYEAHSPVEDALLKSVRRLPAPDGYGDSLIAVEIQTTLGADYLISQLEPAAVELDTPAGMLQTDARIAVASMRNGDLVFAAIAEGTTLSINGVRVDATPLQPSHSLAQQAAEASVEQE